MKNVKKMEKEPTTEELSDAMLYHLNTLFHDLREKRVDVSVSSEMNKTATNMIKLITHKDNKLIKKMPIGIIEEKKPYQLTQTIEEEEEG